MRQYPFAIFDMDGTLLDSMGAWKNLGRNYLKSLGICPPKDLEERTAAMSMREGAEYFHRELGAPGTWKEILRDLDSRMEAEYRESLPLKEGVREYLEYLRENEIKMCVLTATPAYMAQAAFARLGIGEYFEFVMDCEETGKKKTEEECYLAAAGRLGGRPEQTAVYEDADFALKTAKKAGFYTVGIYDETMADRRMVLENLCDIYAENFSELWEES